jgi:DNA-binding LacI/PurR family transcriptional regulator
VRAVELLVQRLDGSEAPPVREVFPLELIVRSSCGTAHLR